MTTTDKFQQIPDFYSSFEECSKNKKLKLTSNPRYKHFKQTHFTAGDDEQFEEYRDKTNGNCRIVEIPKNNIFRKTSFEEYVSWSKYKNLDATCVDNTFNYIFNKYKKGTFVKIQNNELKVFLPFSNKNFVNEWSDRIFIHPKYGNMYNFVKFINQQQNKNYKISVNKFADNWYSNNCLVRTEFPINEGDTNIPNMSDMFRTLCASRKLPDIEFFVNRRDFPLITKNETEAYDHMFGDNHPLVSHKYDKYAPILSMVTTDLHADIPIPTGDDWGRIGGQESKFFTGECKKYPQMDEFDIDWEDKKPTAVFRGTSTGCGVTIDTNVRLKLAYLSSITPPDEKGLLLDAGITKWQLRPRKLKTDKYLQTIDIKSMEKMGIKLSSFLSPKEQSSYKYLIHVDGHVSAFRLSLEMSMGCCILLAESKYKLWFRPLLKPMKHYVPIKEDLSDLIEKIKWCRENDEICKKIANNARKFYIKYLQKDGALDYLQKILFEIKEQSGTYLYNTKTPLQIQLEKSISSSSYPSTTKSIKDIAEIPKQPRSFSLLKGLEWIVNLVNDNSDFVNVATKSDSIFMNNLGTVKVDKYKFANFSFAVKSSLDKKKNNENIHEGFIGTNEINDLLQHIPNFSYVFGYKNNKLITEYINGQTFEQWILSNKFNSKDYLFILIQLSMALQVAQKHCGFIHWDLTPWNIMIQELKHEVEFDYVLNCNSVYRVKTKLIPIIIDYGKSHVIHKGIHYGFINMFKMSTIQDVISILLISLKTVFSKKNLSRIEEADGVRLGNFISLTSYRKNVFRKASDIQFFVNRSAKYAELIKSNKYELEKLSPIDFASYINDNFKYTFNIVKLDLKSSVKLKSINKGNPRQVFDFILSSTDEDRMKSFSSVFERILECDFPSHSNAFFCYYSAQVLEDNITSVYNLMAKHYKPSEELYKKALDKINENFKNVSLSNIEYTLKDYYDNLEVAEYDENTFLIPDVILDLLKKYENYNINKDLAEYKNIVETVLINTGVYRLKQEDKEYYEGVFGKLLEIPSLNINNNSANISTLYEMSKEVYERDMAFVVKQKECNEELKKYLSVYKSIVK